MASSTSSPAQPGAAPPPATRKAPPAARSATASPPTRGRRIRLRHLLFLIILLPSILPLVVSSVVLIQRNRETLKTQQQELLTHSAQQFVGALSETLARQRVQIEQLGRAIVAAPITQDRAGDGGTALEARLREPWVEALLGDFVREQRFVSFAALTQDRVGMRSSNAHEPQIDRALIEAFDTALRLGEPAYRFATLSQGGSPVVATAVPIPTIDGQDVLVVQALLPIDFERASSQQAFEVDDFFLVDADGELLWTGSRQERVQQALLNSPVVEDFARNPLLTTVSELTLDLGDSKMPILARVVQVRETGWGLVAHKAKDVAFQQVSNMVFEAFLASLLAIMLALFFAIIATRWFSRPFQRLANASHEIAAGKFDRRVPLEGLATREVAELAGDFNRMGDYVQNYIEQLRRAAEANRALFISSIRAFAAAIDAKDPYTRGHSERVAAYSRSISVYLGLPKDMQEKVWISGVLHDVGKIGVQDRVLLKQGVLTEEEFDQMKLHPSIGAEIIEPISALEEMIPGIRWHHEAWNGTGYPDRLKGDQIPLMARIIGVADTFDAITTNRPYQTASSPEYAIETIKKLTGTKFDARVVTAFLLAWEAGHIKLDRERAERSSHQMRTPQPAGAKVVSN